VPQDAPAQAAQFKASVRDVLAPDDTRVEGQTVAINVTPDAVPPTAKKKGLPWWVWLIAGLVVVGVGIGIYLICCGKKAEVPNVVGMTVEEASDALTTAGFDSVAVKDTTGDQSRDTNRVVRQEPEAESEMPKVGDDKELLATIVVNRLAGRVPIVVTQTQGAATRILTELGFAPITVRDTLVRGSRLVGIDRVLKQEPAAGSVLPPDSMRGRTAATIWMRRAASIVPDVIGVRAPTAREQIRSAGLRVGDTSTRTTFRESRHGMVYSVTPPPETLVRRDSEVDLGVYRYLGLPLP
jgi:beta-lactam-binding protein with PASTA domain